MKRGIKRSAVAAAAVGVIGAVVGGCLDRDVVSRPPSVNTIVSSTLTNQTIDKLDLLFVIDNSASMGDKQAYLAAAVPALITRLVTPNCVDATTGTIYGQSDSSGNCSMGQVEFPPVHDMHIGVLSSSLGTRLSDQYGGNDQGTICSPTNTLTLTDGTVVNNHDDDRGELLNRSGAHETPLADTGTSNYLNYFPNVAANDGKQPSEGAPAITDPAQLESDFSALVAGIGTYGCGIESQLESWYRFLIQPDPYDSMTLVNVNGASQASWVGVDTTILQQRARFLRPDSLVAIIDMTDEDDSEIDVRSIDGQGYAFMSQTFNPPRGTSGCDENATNSGLFDPSTCNSCDFVSSSVSGSDPSCAMGPYTAGNDWGANENLRHVHMTQKYGIAPQFPISRYVNGLTSTTVPDRNGEYPPGAQSYEGQNDCVNPLFAASLPDGSSTDPATLCHLTLGTRTPDLVYYAHIGGVPHQLLQATPGSTAPGQTDAAGKPLCAAGTAQADCPQKDTLAVSDWTAILGNDPENQDYTGADPHMIESYQPRPGIAAPTSPPAGGNPDPINGRDWITNQGSGHVLEVDREYACTFTLTNAQGVPTPRDCTNTADPDVAFGCDCPSVQGSVTYEELPPICDPTTQTMQVGAKAYPTIRELLLAEKLGPQGIVSSLCPIHVAPTNDDDPPDPLYGYRPAMTAIVDRLKVSLNNQCSPQKLAPVLGPDGGTTGEVSCLVLVALPPNTAGGTCDNPGAACDAAQGLLGPSNDPNALFQQTLLDEFCSAHTLAGAQPQITADQPVCALQQIIVDPSNTQNCAKLNTKPGWCYVQGPAALALGCTEPNTIAFTTGEPPPSSVVSLECLETAVSVTGGGDAGGGGD